MPGISTTTGLVSGINTKDVIDQLMALEAAPKDALQKRVDSVNQQKLAFADLSASLVSIKLFGTTIKKAQTFGAAKTSTSDENVLTATASNGAAIGSYQFQVARLVTTQQAVSQGFSDISTRVGAGTLTIEQGGGEITAPTALSQLNGGQGIQRGLFRITDGSGHSSVIDISNAINVDDVLKKINTSLDINVKATVSGDQIKLTDNTGLTTAAFSVTDLSDGHAAADLGLAGVAAAAGVITGGDINYLGRSTNLNSLNDSRGVRRAGGAGGDFSVTSSDGTWTVSLANARTIGDVIDQISTTTGGKVTASVDAGGNGLKLTGAGTVAVAEVNSSKAATDLGIVGSGAGTLAGGPILAGLNTVLVASLNGGSGFNLGSIKITNAAGISNSVSLAAAKSVQDIFDAINGAGLNLKAGFNTSGNGIRIADNSTGPGQLKVEEDGGTTAADLAIAGTAKAGSNFVNGGNLQRQWVSETSLLSDYNGGKGVGDGKFKITNSKGNTASITVNTSTEKNLGDIIRDINNRPNLGVTASINQHGDGLLLTDTAGGSLKLKVENVDGTSADDLNLTTSATKTATTIDGSFEKTVTVTSTDTLATVQQKLADLNFGVIAQVVSDGSDTAPFRLSLTAKNAGRNARVVFDGGSTDVQAKNLVDAQDAAVFLGSADSTDPLLITSGKNQIAGIIKGVTIDLHSTSDKPVTLGITRDSTAISDQVSKFVDSFNALADKITALTKYDTTTNTAGLLLGDSTVQTVESNLYNILGTTVANAGKYRILADVGITLGDGGKLNFDSDKFSAAYANDPDSVQRLFTTAQDSLGDATPAAQLNSGRGVRTLGPGKPDFKIDFRDGTTVNVTLGNPSTLKELIDTINTQALGKAKAQLRDDGEGITFTDLTGATVNPLKLTASAGSQALIDLRLTSGPVGNVISGGKIVTTNATNATSGGVGYAIESLMNKLIDPVTGVITRENQTLDGRTKQFTDRIDQLDKLLTQKRTRLETQFANLESVLSQLQSQQASIGQIKSAAA